MVALRLVLPEGPGCNSQVGKAFLSGLYMFSPRLSDDDDEDLELAAQEARIGPMRRAKITVCFHVNLNNKVAFKKGMLLDLNVIDRR